MEKLTTKSILCADVRSQLLKYLDSYGYGNAGAQENPNLAEAPREFLTGFGRKTNLDYILVIDIPMRMYGRYLSDKRAEIRMVVKLLDVVQGQYLFYDVFESEGRSSHQFLSDDERSAARAAYKALEIVMKRYEVEVKMP